MTTPVGHVDVVGTLVSVRPDGLEIRRRDGSLARVRHDDVIGARVVAPTPARRIDAGDLQRVAALGWRAWDTATLGDWLLRAAAGFTSRANTALAVGDPGRPLPDALDAVARWYAARGLPARVQVVVGSAEDAAVTAAGWRSAADVVVMTAEAGHVLRALPARDALTAARVDDVPDDAWVSAYGRGATATPDVVRRVVGEHPTALFASVRDDTGRCVAIARSATDGKWVGVSAVEVVAQRRREGLARLVTAAALREAVARHGARHAYLQVADDNVAAGSLYASVGFVEHHRYTYRSLPPAAGNAAAP